MAVLSHLSTTTGQRREYRLINDQSYTLQTDIIHLIFVMSEIPRFYFPEDHSPTEITLEFCDRPETPGLLPIFFQRRFSYATKLRTRPIRLSPARGRSRSDCLTAATATLVSVIVFEAAQLAS